MVVGSNPTGPTNKNMEKYKGTALIAVNDKNQVLLHLRDDKPTIPFPNSWQFPGGRVEEGESPKQAIVREVAEEWDGFELKDFEFFKIIPSGPYDNYIFYTHLNFDPQVINLLEGQEIRWFDFEEARKMKLADTDNITIEAFAKEHNPNQLSTK